MQLDYIDGLRTEDEDELIITDEMVDALFTSPSHDNALREADKKRKGLSKEEFYILRAQAKRDLFFLGYGVLQYERFSPNLHGHLCKDLFDYQDERFRLYLLPRGHFKSTLITITHSIQVVLPYGKEEMDHDEFAHIPLSFPQSLGTNCRLLIAHETHESASRYLYSITNHFTQNVTLMTLFPECVPSKKSQRVNKWELELPRTKIWGEPTIDTLGVGGKSQGRHYNLINLDDIFGDKARDSLTERTTTNQWLDNIQSFFSKFTQDHLLMNGTRYSFDDSYAHMMDRYGDKLHVYTRSVTEFSEKTQQQEPIFPEEFTLESLEILKKNPVVYNSQYLNDPEASGEGFQEEWKRHFYWKSTNQIVLFDDTVDDTHERETIINIRDMDRVILIDPGEKSGGFVVTGMDHLGRVATLVAMRIALKSPSLVDLIFNCVQRWQPRLVAIEADFFMHTYQHWLRSEMKLRGVYFHVEPVYTKKVAKKKRIWGLAPYWEAGLMYTNEKQTDLDTEFNRFGKTEDIHILDGLAYGPEVWQKGKFPGTYDDDFGAVKVQNPDRDIETGYSVIN